MSIDNSSKIQKVLQSWPAGTVNTSVWFTGLGVSAQLLKKYTANNWLQSHTKGAYIKTGDTVAGKEVFTPCSRKESCMFMQER